MSKYKLIPEGNRYRLISQVEIPGVCKPGDRGGLVESEYNLGQEGNCWVTEHAMVLGQARVSDNALILQNAVVQHKARVFDNAVIYGSAVIEQWAKVFENAQVGDSVVVAGNASVYGDAKYTALLHPKLKSRA
jgi:carbonic anhydrase/acetyltransferase-like protein (isoleucine patch superfamily)